MGAPRECGSAGAAATVESRRWFVGGVVWCGGSRQPGRGGSGSLSQVVGEHGAFSGVTEGEDHEDDQAGDAGDEQAVLDGGRAALSILAKERRAADADR